MKIGTLTTGVGVVTTIQLAFVPERIRFIAATQLTGIKVNVLGVGIITDLDAAGINALGRQRLIGYPANGYQIQLADGEIQGKNCEIIITNSAAQTPEIYAESTNKGGAAYVKSLRQTCFASTSLSFKNFLALGLTNTGATDDIDITFADGQVNKTAVAELTFLVSPFSNDTAQKVIDNFDKRIAEVRLIPAAQQIVYVQELLLTNLGEAMIKNILN